MLSIIQVLLRKPDIQTSASRPQPAGPGFPQELIERAGMMVVLNETSADGLTTTYEYRLMRLHRPLGVRKISCAQQAERRRAKLPFGNTKRAPVAQLQRPATLRAAPDDAGDRCLKGVVMGGTGTDDLEYAISAITKLSALVDRTAYGDEPEEADAAQRQGHEAIRRLRLLKGSGDAGADDSQSEEKSEDALAA